MRHGASNRIATSRSCPFPPARRLTGANRCPPSKNLFLHLHLSRRKAVTRARKIRTQDREGAWRIKDHERRPSQRHVPTWSETSQRSFILLLPACSTRSLEAHPAQKRRQDGVPMQEWVVDPFQVHRRLCAGQLVPERGGPGRDPHTHVGCCLHCCGRRHRRRCASDPRLELRGWRPWLLQHDLPLLQVLRNVQVGAPAGLLGVRIQLPHVSPRAGNLPGRRLSGRLASRMATELLAFAPSRTLRA